MSKIVAYAECASYRATGVYRGFCEPVGEAVICLTCKGTGCQQIEWEPFIKRKRRNGISFVSQSKGSFLATGVGAVGKKLRYDEWFKSTEGKK